VPLSGTLTGTVRRTRGTRTAGAPFRRTVTVTRTAAKLLTLTTDKNGGLQVPHTLNATQYVVTRARFGYLTGTENVFIEGNTTAPDILLQKVRRNAPRRGP